MFFNFYENFICYITYKKIWILKIFYVYLQYYYGS